jgi:hypothetical protein
MPRPLDVEERLGRHAQAYRRDVTPPATLHHGIMVRATTTTVAPSSRSLARELAIAFALLLVLGLLALGFSRLRTLMEPQAAHHGQPPAVAASPIPWINATPSPQTSPLASPQAIALDQVAPYLKTTVTGASPVLLPTLIPAGFSATATASENDFDVRYTGPNNRTFELSIVVANPPPPGPHGTQTMPNFRGDHRSLYQVNDSTQARGQRFLMWMEPGVWSGNALADPGVPYFLTADGLTDAEFWRIANSIQVIASAHPCSSADVSPAFGGIYRIGHQPMVTIYLINHGTGACFLQGVPAVSLQATNGITTNLPVGSWDSGAAPGTPLLLRSDPGLTVIPGLAYVRFSALPCTDGRTPTPVGAVRISLPGVATPLVLSAGGSSPFTMQSCDTGGAESSVNAGRLSALSPTLFKRGPATLSVDLRAPRTATIGQTLHYTVILTNVTSRPFIYDTCPSYVETLGAASVTSGHYLLNCGAIGAWLPGQSLAFDIQLAIPADGAPGSYLLTWSMDPPYAGVNSGTAITLVH